MLPRIELPGDQSKKDKCIHPLVFQAHDRETKQLLRERGKRRRGRIRRGKRRKRKRRRWRRKSSKAAVA